MEQRTPTRGPSLNEQSIQILTERIKSGLYPPGSKIPADHELAAEFAVSRATIRSAVSSLAERSLVVRRNGVGTFVTNLARLANPLNEARDFNYLIARQGSHSKVEYVRVALAKPDSHVAAALALEADHPVLESYKVFLADGVPLIYCVNAIPRWVLGEELAQALVAEPEPMEPLYDLLEEQCDQRTEYHVSQLAADVVENCPFPALPFEASVPMLVIEEVGYNAKELPLWHSTAYFPANQMKFELVRHRIPGG